MVVSVTSIPMPLSGSLGTMYSIRESLMASLSGRNLGTFGGRTCLGVMGTYDCGGS